MELLIPVLSALLVELLIKIIEKIFRAKNFDSDGTLSLEQVRWQKFLYSIRRFASTTVFLIAVGALCFYALQQVFFPRIEGCVMRKGAVTYNIPWGNPGSPLTMGCGYFFDMQNEKGDWYRLSSDNSNIDGQWVEASYIDFRLCRAKSPTDPWWRCVVNKRE